jgi:hypothetical protein
MPKLAQTVDREVERRTALGALSPEPPEERGPLPGVTPFMHPCGLLIPRRGGTRAAGLTTEPCPFPATVRGKGARESYCCVHHAWELLGAGYVRDWLTNHPYAVEGRL